MFGRSGTLDVAVGLMLCIGCGNTSQTKGGAGAAGSPASGGRGVAGAAAAGPDGGSTGMSGGTGGATGGVPGTGGTPATGGSPGTGGAPATGGSPATGGTGGGLNLPPASKIDLLFVVDNSPSMAHNQALLSGSIPALINRLLNPDCVDPSGNHTTGTSVCPSGGHREFAPVTDLHVGVVTTSIGGHGADLCSATSSQFKPAQDDHAHLLPTVRTGLPSFNNLGFLAWNPTNGAPAGSINDPPTLINDLTAEVNAAGETGCGFEGQLESMYRFLVDPDPPSAVTVSNNQAAVTYPDATTLAQRAAFLRPDSLVGVVVLSDENDCSVMDGGIGWLVGSSTIGSPARQFHMPPPTSTCATDPNSPCCRSCGIVESTVPAGCVAVTQDPACTTTSLSATADPLNLRCWDQKRRFGIDLLQPVQRYITGLTSPTVVNRAGQSVKNPLFFASATATQQRDASHVFTLGIVGVPWQDIATSASLTGAGLEYLTPAELRSMGRWATILGDPAANPAVLPLDPLMLENEVPRTGTSPIVNQPLGPANSTNPQLNSINGHEYYPSIAGDLEYACIYPFAVPVTCTASNLACDCVPDFDGGTTAIMAANRPLCQPPTGGAPGTTQYYGKAYPGIRELELLKALGDNGVVSSLCAKYPSNDTDPAYGFKPAFKALIDRIAPALVRP